MKLKINQTKLLNALVILSLCVIAFGAGYWINGSNKSPDEVLITTAYQMIMSDSIYNQHTDRELSYAAIRGMLTAINDPYSELIEPDAAQNFAQTFTGQMGVVGLFADKVGDRVVITIIFPGQPADKAGLRVGDVILAVDNVILNKDADSSETGLLIRGAPGSTVHLKVQRDTQSLEFDVVRQLREYVSFRMLPDGIAYIANNAFNSTASQKMKEGLTALLAQKPVGLVWDLRNNEGGDMQAAQDILSDFIKQGLLFSAELADNQTVQFSAKGNPIAGDIPLVVLMDKTTYSAAETSAAAVAETGRGQTIGSNSYGKGVIQATINLPEKALLQMTVARWHSPSGQWYQGRGVAPQIAVNDDPATTPDEVLQKAVEILTKK